MSTLEGSKFVLRINTNTGCFDILGKNNPVFQLLGCELRIDYLDITGRMDCIPIQLHESDIHKVTQENGRQLLSIKTKHTQSGLEFKIDFWFEQGQHALFWQVKVCNHSQRPIFIRQIGLLRSHYPQTGNLKLETNQKVEDCAFFSNGWQSWSFRGAYRCDQRMRSTRLGFLQEPMVFNAGTPKPGLAGHFSSDFFAVLGDKRSRRGLLIGFLSQQQHFGSLHANLIENPSMNVWANGDDARLDPGASMQTDVVMLMPIDMDVPDSLGDYLQVVASHHQIKEFNLPPSGWCSWYEYYQTISETIIQENLDILNSIKPDLPLNLLQIDDGFQAQVGDWFDFSSAFPNGVKNLAAEIKHNGFTPGLWLAPFILHPGSRIARQHPEWLLRTANGRLARAGFGWDRLTVALDLTVPEALDYASQVVHTAVHDWGFPYIKLDFLYAAAVRARYRDRTRTRAQVLRSGMQALRDAAGDETFLLGCGAPLGSVIGMVDAMRIGADVSDHWRPAFQGISFPFRDEPFMPCVRNAIQNILTSAPMHNRWWVNDPDCLVMRPDAHLNLDEVQTLATAIAMTGGLLLLSDALSKLNPERLRIAACLLPPINQRARVVDWLDSTTPTRIRLDLNNASGAWTLAALFNWEEIPRTVIIQPTDFKLSAKNNYLVRSFWEGIPRLAAVGSTLAETVVQPHGVVLLAVRQHDPEIPIYAGSDLHISQGLEVIKWRAIRDGLKFDLNIKRRFDGSIDLYLPKDLNWAELDDKRILHESLGDRFYRLGVEGLGRAKLLLRYKL